MFVPLNIFLIAALLCVVMLLVLTSLLHSGAPGVKEWIAANVLACVAFILYAYGKELPPLIAYEVANGVYAAASAAMLFGMRRFFGRRTYGVGLILGVALVTVAIAAFHYYHDSFALRTVTVSLFQSAIGMAIAITAFQSRHSRRSRYPYLFTKAMATVIAIGHAARAIIYVMHSGEMTSLLQPSAWNLLFISAGTMALPVLTLGAIMMVHDMMMTRAEHAANRDFLTSAWSRRAFFTLADVELTRAQRTGRALSLLAVDIDNFKTINDTLGHAAGDQVLIEIVARAAAAIRNIDYLGRIGGEEFAVLLPETDRTAALVVAERLRAGLQYQTSAQTSAEDAQKDPRTIAITVSIGVATLGSGETFQSLLQRADAALYHAKATGRNRVADAGDGLPHNRLTKV